MALSPVVEFLAAQRDPSGRPLCHFGTSQITAVLTPGQQVMFRIVPPNNFYGNFAFRVLMDKSNVPGAFTLTVRQWGAVPYLGTPYESGGIQYLDYFLRVTATYPIVNLLVNNTLLNQRFISHDQSLVVRTQQDWYELERRMEKHFGAIGGE